MAGEVRLGIIVPSANTVVEKWYPKVVPDGASVHLPAWRLRTAAPRRVVQDQPRPGEGREIDAEIDRAGSGGSAAAGRGHGLSHPPYNC